MDKIINRALYILNKYEALNNKNNLAWVAEDYMAGFVGDVGDLSKLTMAKRGLRGNIKNIDKLIAHELSDCLWSICVLANKYDLDIEKSFYKTMNEIEKKLNVA